MNAREIEKLRRLVDDIANTVDVFTIVGDPDLEFRYVTVTDAVDAIGQLQARMMDSASKVFVVKTTLPARDFRYGVERIDKVRRIEASVSRHLCGTGSEFDHETIFEYRFN